MPDVNRSTRTRRVVAVNRYFWPDHSATSQLLTDLARSLVEHGTDVTVVASRLRYDDPSAALTPRETHDGIRVRRVWTTRFGRDRLVGRAIDYATFYASVFFVLVREVRRGDVLLAKTDPPLISVVAWPVASLKGARLVNWCQDLFPEIAEVLGVRIGPLGGVLRRLRNVSLRRATTNVALCQPMAERLHACGVASERIAVIHNWVDGEAIKPVAPADNPLRAAWGYAPDDLVVGYSGNLGRAHDERAILDVIEALRDETGLYFLFIGAGAGMTALKREVAARGLRHVRFEPYQPYDRLADSLSAPDVHLVSLRPACEGLIMPSKLYGVLAAGRPVLFLGDERGAVARIVEAHSCGFATNEASAAARWLRTLRQTPERRAQLGQGARRLYDSELNRTVSLNAWRAVLCAEQAGGRGDPHA